MLYYILFPIILLAISLLCFFAYLNRKCEFSQDLSRLEINFYQHQVDTEKQYQDLIRDASIDKSMARLKLHSLMLQNAEELAGCDSVLRPTSESGFNGEIVFKKDYDDKYVANFTRYHEIIHYVDDVGIGKKVRRVYAKDPTGETSSHKEQIKNFKAAAVAIPKSDLLNDLKSCADGSYFDRAFLVKMQEKYKQPIETITRRISEVAPRS